MVAYKGKYYACGKDGVLFTSQNEFKRAVGIDGDSGYVRVKDSTGALMTGLQTFNDKKYLFTAKGMLCRPGQYASGLIGGPYPEKAYLSAMAIGKYTVADPHTWYIYAPGKTIIYDDRFVISKDGSLAKDGWQTVDGKKYYVFQGYLAESGGIVKIGGKYYTFNDNGSVHTGWYSSDNVYIADAAEFTSVEYPGTFYFYFNEKTGAMETGWKTMKAPKINSAGAIVDDVASAVTGPKKKIYFNTASTDSYPIGALVCSTDMTVSGKLYRFAGDGSVAAGKEGFVFADPKSDSFDGLKSYIKADGTMARGRTLVKTAAGDFYYYFGLEDGIKEVNVIRKTGNKWYYYGYNGQQSTSLFLLHRVTNHTVTAIFNADGSIKNFAFMDSMNTVIKNDYLRDGNGASNGIIYIGKNGLPTTGKTEFPTFGRTALYEEDGRTAGNFKDNSNLQLRKVGSKYYMFADGLLLDKSFAQDTSSKLYRYYEESRFTLVETSKEVFSKLPDSDKKEIEKCIKFNELELSKSTSIYVALNEDGSVRTGAVKPYDVTYYANKYGIIKDTVSMFVNQGGWRMTGLFTNGMANRAELSAICLGTDKYPGTGLIISWDDSGKLLSITDSDTGKNANGLFIIQLPTGKVIIFVKNGKLSTGKTKLKYYGMEFSITIDKDYGVAEVPAFLEGK